MTEAIINPQALLVKSYHHRKAFPVGYLGAQVLRPASRYPAPLRYKEASVSRPKWAIHCCGARAEDSGSHKM